MADIKVKVKMQIPGGGANPGVVGTALGPHGIDMMGFCREFNSQTSSKKGDIVPVIITIFTNRKFEFILKTEPTPNLIRKRLNLKKGSSRPHEDKVGKLTQADLEEIAKIKLVDLNSVDLATAKKIVAGTARSMGVDIVD